MAGIFAIILTLATFITGVLWFLERFKWAPARQRKVEAVRKQTDGNIDGAILAEVGKPKSWVDSLSSLFPILFVVFVIRSFLYEPYQIPSGSMMPTLLIGDFIVVQKYAYGLKDPVTNTTFIATGKPLRGDLAVFKHPNVPQMDLIKRVVGLPGDKLVYLPDEKQLLIYPACQPEGCQGQQSEPLDLKYGSVSKSDWKEVFTKNSTNFYTNEAFAQLKSGLSPAAMTFDLNTRQEQVNGHGHQLLLLPMAVYGTKDFYKQTGQQPGEWVVPAGHYFMMGDNRDNSDDSRFWGFVPEANLVGRASAIWMSFDKQPDEWPTGIRFSRIGGIN